MNLPTDKADNQARRESGTVSNGVGNGSADQGDNQPHSPAANLIEHPGDGARFFSNVCAAEYLAEGNTNPCGHN